MRKLILFSMLILFSFSARSTHNGILGGEITWKCVSESGINKYKFKLIIYTNCTSNFPTTSNLLYLNVCNTNAKITQFNNNYTMPGTNDYIVDENGRILLKKISVNNIFPNCSFPSATTYTCAQTSNVSYVKIVYESEAINFYGIQPPNSNIPIVFSYSNHGRSSVTNSDAIQSSFVITAKMFPFIDTKTGNAKSVEQCFDSAPDFSEPPMGYVFSNGLDYTLNNSGLDLNADSLVYSLSNPIVSYVSLVNNNDCPVYLPEADIWKNYPNYSLTNPLGVSNSNFNLNSKTGVINFKSSILGSFVMVPTITSYKNGQKISEVYRDFIWRFLVDGAGSNTNRAPTISQPFVNASGVKTSIQDVVAGNSISIPILIRDSIVGGAGISPHEVQFTVNGIAMGSANADTLVGCPFPNCAVLSRKKYPTPYTSVNNPFPELMQNTSILLNGYGYNLGAAYSAIVNDTAWLYWKTDFSNLNLDNGNAIPKSYDFSITAKDNFCIPKMTSAIFSINVISPNFVKSPKVTCIDYNASSNAIKLNWLPTTGDAATFVRYDIYRNSTIIYSTNNINLITYIDNSIGASIDSFYYVRAINTYGFLDKVEPKKFLQFNYHSNDSVCIGTPTILSVDTIIGGSQPYSSIQFLGDDGLNMLVNSDIKSVSYTFPTIGIKKYSIVVTDKSGCKFEIYDSILVRNIPAAKIVSDIACKSSVVNLTLSDFVNNNLDSIWWRGDYDNATQTYLFDRNGVVSDFTIRNPKWIFSSNNGIGKFPISARLKNIFGCISYIYDTVDVGLPIIELLDPNSCCNSSDTISFTTSYLTKPYISVKWIDNSTNIVLLNDVDKFPVSLLTGRTSINLKVQLEDAKGCEAFQIKNYNLTTGLSDYKQSQISIHPNPTNSFITITGLPENEPNDLFIFDVLGKEVYSQKVQGTTELNLSSLSKGVYFVRIGATTRKVIKN